MLRGNHGIGRWRVRTIPRGKPIAIARFSKHFWGSLGLRAYFSGIGRRIPASGGPGDLGYTPQNKPAQEILRKFFGGEENHSSENLEKVASYFWSTSEEGRNRGEFCPVYERKEVVYWEQSLLGKPAQSEFQNAKEV
jgi:hypothetical protein